MPVERDGRDGSEAGGAPDPAPPAPLPPDETAVGLPGGADARIRALYAQTPLALGFSRDGIMLDANPAYLRLFGYASMAELRGTSILAQIAPQCRADVEAKIRRRAAAEQVPDVYETIGLRKDGAQFPFRATVTRTQIEDGPLTIAAIDDLTELRESQDRLRDALELQERLVAASPIGIAVYATNGQCVAANEAAAHTIGASRERMLGQNFMELPSWRGSGLLDAAKRALDADEPQAGDFHMVTTFGREVWLSCRLTPFRRRGERFLLAQLTDVTEKVRSEQALRASEELYRAIVESSLEGIAVADRDFRISYANPRFAAMLGYGQDELLRRHPASLIVDEDRPTMLQGLEERKAGKAATTELRYRHRDGTTVIHGIVSAHPLFDGDGAFDGVVALVTDISARKAAEDALRAADRHKTEFLAALSHELRNPLAAIRAGVGLLGANAALDPAARHTVAVLERQTAHLTRLVDDLLDLTRITHGKIRVSPGEVDLAQTVRLALNDYGAALAGHEVTVDVPAAPVWVAGDATRLAQVVGNLLVNAAKFTPAGGRIAVSLVAGDGNAVLEVADTGVGIGPATLGRLFQPFEQSGHSLDRSGGGLGLGLALVKGIVDLHGGTVQAHSDGEGLGARFSVRLPLAPTAPSAPPPAPPPRPARRQSVLLIEDNRDAADTLRAVLEVLGHRVAVAHTGLEGIARAADVLPEIVLCDLGLPDMSGLAVARALRDDPRHARAHLVALSGYAQAEDRRRALAAGFDAHLGKPIAMHDLARFLDEVAEPAEPPSPSAPR